ncbi:hypothetical protein CHARACLAT_032491 [Characodon lateralis]|uniref:Uncharacterized protein n=1 Tax=Characodon lateralis TaxID=208331 RepID=A0ABU7E9L8_9TELE|nr:hypothetical protein [Characodon lateralis]
MNTFRRFTDKSIRKAVKTVGSASLAAVRAPDTGGTEYFRGTEFRTTPGHYRNNVGEGKFEDDCSSSSLPPPFLPLLLQDLSSPGQSSRSWNSWNLVTSVVLVLI